MLKFSEEMLIPLINIDVYLRVYELENWLRRICLTSYTTKYGEEWTSQIPRKVHKRLEHQVVSNSKLSYLGSEDDKNFIWSATLGQLKQMMDNKNIANHLEKLTNIEHNRFINKIDELREVRNLLAHNRALSESSNIIVNGIIESLKVSVMNFKTKILYNDMEILDFKYTDYVAKYFVEKMEGNDWSKFPSGAKLIEIYKDDWEDILAFLINKQGDEYTILISKKVKKEKIEKIIDKFITNPNVWTEKSFINQNPKYICNPKFWMYENRKQIDE